MVILLAALVLGGLAWLWQRHGSNGMPVQTFDVPLRSVGRPAGGRLIPAGRHADGQIVVSGLTKQYQGVRAVDNLSFAVEPGRVTGFLGSNGAGMPVTELRHSLLARLADCRSPGQRSSSRTRPPSWTYCVRERSATRC